MLRMNLVDINGVLLEVARIGAPGPNDRREPLLFLHEGLGSIAQWGDWPASLCAATGREGVVYSRRGYGGSSPVPDVRGAGRLGPDYMHREALQVLPALFERIGIRQPVLVGHSDGGTIALIHAAHHPVSACVALAPHVMVEDISVSGIEEARHEYEHGSLRERLARHHDDVDSAFWQWNDVWLSPAFRAFDIRKELGAITAPLLCIQGEQDRYGTLAQIRDVQSAVPAALLLEIADCGHSPHRDQRDTVNAAIANFLRDVN